MTEFRTRLRFKPGVKRVLTVVKVEPCVDLHKVRLHFKESRHVQIVKQGFWNTTLEPGYRVQVTIQCIKHDQLYLNYKINRILKPSKGTIFEQLIQAGISGRTVRRDLP